MPRGLDESTLLAEWLSLARNWYSIYQWPRTTGAGYTEWIAGWIGASFAKISLATDGLRDRSLRVKAHRGQIHLKTPIKQFTEKRFVRALFNLSDVPLLGTVLDYEIPLKETGKASHGKIDLLCQQAETMFVVEAKKLNANESVLKAILEAFVYTSLVATRRKTLVTDYGMKSTIGLAPAVLVFAASQAGRQLKRMAALPNLLSLIRLINTKLENDGILPMRFFVIENEAHEFADCLTTRTQANADVQAVFRDGFTLSIAEVKVV